MHLPPVHFSTKREARHGGRAVALMAPCARLRPPQAERPGTAASAVGPCHGTWPVQFNSINYIVFLPLVAVGYFALPLRWRWAWLLAASYYFYGCWNPAYLVLLLASTLVDFCVALALGRCTHPSLRPALLLVSLALNLGLLFTFKYFNFFAESMSHVAGAITDEALTPYHLDVLLPAGISFYTFQTLAYTIDVYRGHCPPERHAGRFALYVAFFPQLVAGPIERAAHLLPQFREQHHWDYERTVSGLRLILWGLFKKMVVADRMALIAGTVYGEMETPAGPLVVLGTIAFAFQIYCDFSAYSDIAVGSARILGINLMLNFNRPYAAQSIRDFWRRWHISLSVWFRDYVYLPLGGGRVSGHCRVRNIALVFLLSGLWHGAEWTFICWGALHAFYYLVGEALAKVPGAGFAESPGPLRVLVRRATVFALVCFAWIFFRATSLDHAMALVTALPSGWVDPELLAGQWAEFTRANPLSSLGFGICVLAALLLLEGSQEANQAPRPYHSARWPVRWMAYGTTLFLIFALGVYHEVPFIYFRF